MRAASVNKTKHGIESSARLSLDTPIKGVAQLAIVVQAKIDHKDDCLAQRMKQVASQSASNVIQKATQ